MLVSPEKKGKKRKTLKGWGEGMGGYQRLSHLSFMGRVFRSGGESTNEKSTAYLTHAHPKRHETEWVEGARGSERGREGGKSNSCDPISVRYLVRASIQ